MKKHAIIPVFISHRGCPNNCVFCNQKKITARSGDVTPEDAKNTIEQWLTTLGDCKTIEVSFYGGSFTGIPIDEQRAFLEVAKQYKDAGRIHKIHLSTRPDYINKDILDNLKAYDVDIIELGCQSFDDEVLRLCGRGHDANAIYRACDLIKEYGFTLGIQLMVGLPGETMESCIISAKETVKIAPQIARLYPTVTIKDTELYEMYMRGEFKPLSLNESVKRTKEMYKIIDNAGINIIRVGLKSSEIMSEEVGFHPAFRQLVESEIARDEISRQIEEFLDENCPEWEFFGGVDEEINSYRVELICIANEHCYGNMFGHKAMNRIYYETKYPMVYLTFGKDYEHLEDLRDNEYIVRQNLSSIPFIL